MPKLKPLKDEKEIAAVPLDQPVLVELEPPVSGTEDDGAVQRTAERDPEPADDGAKALQDQLAASQEATRIANERAARAERDRLAAQEEAERLKTQGADTEKELLGNSLKSAQDAMAAAEAELERAFTDGDAKAMAKAQATIGRTAAQIANYEGAIAAAEEQTKADKERPKPKVDLITAIDRNPDLLPAEREWLKKHPEVLTDKPTNRELEVGYARAMKKGFKRGTEGYFKFLDEFLGYAEAPAAGAQDDPDADRNERPAIVSAPVNRDNRSSLTNRPVVPTRITLTPEQREFARNMGISDVQYAKGYLQMEANKKADPERFAGQR